MKIVSLAGFVFCLGAASLAAQEAGSVESLKRQLEQVKENFEKAQAEHRRQIEDLTRKLNEVQQRQESQGSNQAALQQLMTKPWPEAKTTPPPIVDGKRWSPSDPITLLGGARNYINLSFNGLFAAGTSTTEDVGSVQLGGHDPQQRGFTVQNLELTLEGKVDPYFRGQANVVLAIDASGETIIEAEEAYLETMALPWNLQLKAGQYLTEFGRLNPTHPHSWAFVDQPLVSGRFLGGDGLRNPGARISWLMPLPFYSELFLSVQNSGGETANSFRSTGAHAHGGEEEEETLPFALRHPDNDRGVRHIDDLLFAPRYQTSFELTDAQTLLLGASAAFGPNQSGEEGDTRTQIYGVDLTWKWKPVSHHAGFPFVQWQSEAMLRRFKAGAFSWDENGNGVADAGELVDLRTGAPASFGSETLTDYGIYSQLLYGFRKGWVAGLRGDYVWGELADYEKFAKSLDGGLPFRIDPARDRRWRISPNITWYPTEFSKIRLQYNYDYRRHIGEDHSFWLQMEFLLGTHGAHKF